MNFEWDANKNSSKNINLTIQHLKIRYKVCKLCKT